jgi:uncharacterized SAM-binding protein YcdF (DUF218 family)
MLFFHKLLPMFFLPIGVSLILAVCGVIWKKRALSLAGAGVLWLFSMPVAGDLLMKAASSGYERVSASQMPKADAIVVLSGMLNHVQGAPLGEWSDAADRFEGGIDLYRAGRAPLLVFTGGWIPWKPDHTPEGILLARRAEAMGIPRRAIRITSKVQNTAEEAAAISRMDLIFHASPSSSLPSVSSTPFRQARRTSILLVTSAYHMPRSRMLFTRVGLDVIPYPVDFAYEKDVPFNLLHFLPSARALDRSESALRELIGRAYYHSFS